MLPPIILLLHITSKYAYNLASLPIITLILESMMTLCFGITLYLIFKSLHALILTSSLVSCSFVLSPAIPSYIDFNSLYLLCDSLSKSLLFTSLSWPLCSNCWNFSIFSLNNPTLPGSPPQLVATSMFNCCCCQALQLCLHKEEALLVDYSCKSMPPMGWISHHAFYVVPP